MEHSLNKSLSESNIAMCADTPHTPPNFVSQRNKRPREHDYESDFNNFKEEVKTLISSLITKQSEEIKKISSTLLEIRTTNTSIESSMAFLTSQNEELRKKIEVIEMKAKKDEEYIILLEDKIEDLQRGSRKTTIEIKNAPKIEKETRSDLIKMVAHLSNETKCPIKQNEIKDIFRIPNKRSDVKNGPIVVELTSSILKSDFLISIRTYNRGNKDKLCAKHLGFTTNEYTPIYVSEQLTTKGARLYFLARDLVKSKAYKYCWTSYGQVCVKKDDVSPKIIIKSEMQVTKLMHQIWLVLIVHYAIYTKYKHSGLSYCYLLNSISSKVTTNMLKLVIIVILLIRSRSTKSVIITHTHTIKTYIIKPFIHIITYILRIKTHTLKTLKDYYLFYLRPVRDNYG